MGDGEVVYGSCLDAVQGRRDQELVMTTLSGRSEMSQIVVSAERLLFLTPKLFW